MKREKVDYVYNTPKKKPPAPPAIKTVIKSKMIGTTLIQRVIDKNYEPPLVDLQGFSIY